MSGHGGARPGAGRRPAGPARRVTISFAIDPHLLAALDAFADRLGHSRSELLNEAITVWLDDMPPLRHATLDDARTWD